MTAAKRIDGKAKAAELAASITQETAILLKEHGIKPGLAVVIIGEDPASQVYVRNKKRTAESCGFHSVQHTVAADVSQSDVLLLIDELNNDDAIHGILVQLPLPEHLDEQAITQAIEPSKDVDGFHLINIGKLTAGHTSDAFVPCTPAGCMLMIEDELGSDLSGKNAVVIGRSNIVGKPMPRLPSRTVVRRTCQRSLPAPTSLLRQLGVLTWSRQAGSSPAPSLSTSVSIALKKSSTEKRRWA